MGKIPDIDAFILAGAALLIFMLSVVSKVLGSRKKKKEPKQSEPPKPDAVVIFNADNAEDAPASPL